MQLAPPPRAARQPAPRSRFPPTSTTKSAAGTMARLNVTPRGAARARGRPSQKAKKAAALSDDEQSDVGDVSVPLRIGRPSPSDDGDAADDKSDVADDDEGDEDEDDEDM